MLKFKDSNSFFVHIDEVTRLMKSEGFDTVTKCIKFLFPDYTFYKCSRNGYWGKLPIPRRVNRLFKS